MIDPAAIAEEAEKEARALFALGLYRGACSRAYYAMFNMARALLLLRGREPEATKTHRTVIQMFSNEFVRNGPSTSRTAVNCSVRRRHDISPTIPEVSPKEMPSASWPPSTGS